MEKEEKRKILKEKFVNLFKKFKKNELQNNVTALLTDSLQEKVKSALKHYRLSYSSENFGKVVLHLLKDKEFEVVRGIYNHMCLLDVALHKSRTWMPFSLLNPLSQVRIQDEKQMEKLVLQAIRIEKMNGDIYAKSIDGFIYVMIIFKKLRRNKGIALTQPLYFAVSTENPYFFMIKNQFSDAIVPVIVKALAYEKFHKHSQLSGKNIQSLIQMLKMKANRTEEPEEISFVPQAWVGGRLNFFLDHEERLRHTDHFLGDNFIQLEELNITGPEEFSDEQINLYGNQPRTSMTLRSPDIVQFIRLMAWKGAIKPPFPNYIKKFNVLGKNCIKLSSGRSD